MDASGHGRQLSLAASLIRDIPFNNKSSGAEAATERSEGVAGAE